MLMLSLLVTAFLHSTGPVFPKVSLLVQHQLPISMKVQRLKMAKD
ncbi:hypothetical protein I3843_13G145500 [Carya illinoinensis]|nr:hypothetical protein I3843_13G145500 [Carya illinoinensis]